jgi:methylase of polypeptide subunit release factors
MKVRELRSDLLYRANAEARRIVYRSRTATRILYGSRMDPFWAISYWELGTLAMRQALRRDLKDGQRVLEIGTGPYAVLALWALSRWSLALLATDVDEQVVAHARHTAARNGRGLDVRSSDLFAAVEGHFDVIFFIPPFTPTATVDAGLGQRRLSEEQLRLERLRSRGGERGFELLDRFLAGAPAHLAPGGRVYLAVSRHHHPDGTVESLLPRHGLALVDERRWRLLPYSVYVARALSSGTPGP